LRVQHVAELQKDSAQSALEVDIMRFKIKKKFSETGRSHDNS